MTCFIGADPLAFKLKCIKNDGDQTYFIPCVTKDAVVILDFNGLTCNDKKREKNRVY